MARKVNGRGFKVQTIAAALETPATSPRLARLARLLESGSNHSMAGGQPEQPQTCLCALAAAPASSWSRCGGSLQLLRKRLDCDAAAAADATVRLAMGSMHQRAAAPGADLWTCA